MSTLNSLTASSSHPERQQQQFIFIQIIVSYTRGCSGAYNESDWTVNKKMSNIISMQSHTKYTSWQPQHIGINAINYFWNIIRRMREGRGKLELTDILILNDFLRFQILILIYSF